MTNYGLNKTFVSSPCRFVEGQIATATMDPMGGHRKLLRYDNIYIFYLARMVYEAFADFIPFSPLKRLSKKNRLGKFPKKVSKKKRDGTSSDEAEDRIDHSLVKAVLESYLSSENRKDVLKDPWSNLTEQEVGPFLALECLIRGQGVSNSIQLHFSKLSLLIGQNQCASVGYFDHTPCICKEYKPCFI